MKNGIRIFREKAELSKAEAARRVGTTRQHFGRLEAGERALKIEWAERIAKAFGNCTPQDLMFPELARIDTARFNNVFAVSADDKSVDDAPTLALGRDFLSHLLPGASSHRLRVMMVDGYQSNTLVTKGDAVVIDLDDNQPSRPGLYALSIGGVVQWRHLSPTTSGAIQVHSDNSAIASETVKASDLTVIGRARLRISTI